MQAKGNTFLQADTANITMLVGGAHNEEDFKQVHIS